MKRSTIVMALAVALLAASRASAQALTNPTYTNTVLNSLQINNSAAGFTSQRIQRNVVNSSVPQYNFTPTNYRNLFSSSTVSAPRGQKPFSNLSNPSSVTPYLALSEPFTSSAQSYYTQVRPQLEQQRLNQQIAQRNYRMQQQLTQLAAAPPFNPTGNQTMAPTGHAAVYMNYAGYYPAGAPQRR